MKRVSATLVSVFSISLIAGIFLAGLAAANPIVPSDIEAYSPQNKIYYSSDVEVEFIAPSRYVFPRLNFTLFSYVLDGGSNVTVSGNTTLTGLSWGTHSLIIYGEDGEGNSGSSRTVNFDVFLPTVWIDLIVTAAVATVLAAVVALVHLKKRKPHNSSL